MRSVIAYKSVQLVKSADDIAVMARDMKILEELLERMMLESQRIGQEMNQNKTDYVKVKEVRE